ncbi:hypothetical protein DM01DRAFT_1338319 [Hesseltinella vesiculosa]|uniref:Transcription factor IIIC subunit 5 HTH domain-containing protein n=1 Tax=Hesseltinella vesiculosa TaxID=101127 RepID=A0A1X2GAK6_9FUNG|nr:hypothetical protein DM01DRAFT_1338319 [Hesseltinella vesiculosa]
MEEVSEPHPKYPVGDRTFFCVEYPGAVKNVDRAVNSLGGERAIAQAFQNGDNHRMELRYRPGDPFCHSINGNVVSTPRLLLKVTRRRRRDQPEDQAQVTTEVLGTIPYTCRFRSLGDFQYLVPETDPIYKMHKDLRVGHVENIKEFQLSFDDKTLDNLQNLPPPAFSAAEVPSKYEFKQNAPVMRVRIKQPDGTYKMKLVNRTVIQARLLTSAAFEAENVPTKSNHPLPDPIGNTIQVIDKLKELYKSRPIWSKTALKYRLTLDERKYLNDALPHFAYTFQTGPWRDCWIPYGLDPRKNKKYHIYQQLDFRISPQAKTKVRAQRALHVRNHVDQDARRGGLPSEPSVYEFDGERIPSRSAWFQMCDITDPDFVDIICNPNYLHDGPPTKRYGYYYPSAFLAVRAGIREKHSQMTTEGLAERMPDIARDLGRKIKMDMIEEFRRQQELAEARATPSTSTLTQPVDRHADDSDDDEGIIVLYSDDEEMIMEDDIIQDDNDDMELLPTKEEPL